MVWDSRPPERRSGGRAVRQRPGTRFAAMADDERFRALRRRYRRHALTIVGTFLGWYLLYVLLSAFARGFMAGKVFGDVNVALVLGILQFVSTFALAWWYTAYARRALDPLAAELRREAESADVAPLGVDPGDRRVAPRGGRHAKGREPVGLARHPVPDGAVPEQRARRTAPDQQRSRDGGWTGPIRTDPGWLR
ncbi:hypothetical protein BTM25_00180 [Actinomadura rubteroloni]|uniref:DUF485 domain-containing protein n=2 Tax=Actinomadura rubteroloni TaxID=1926885 RepID=A0A2P4UKP8_9ACTN|nr:hypothetical protein BTM25_00180 [Actinomadura rubteroloni]